MARADPWHRVRHAYITGTTGQRELAEKFGVSARELARRSAEEGWVDARAAFRARAAAKAIDRAGFSTIAVGLKQCLEDPDSAMDESKMEKLFLSLA